MWKNYWKVQKFLLALPLLVCSIATHAGNECREVSILQKTAPPPESCAYDVCYTWTSVAGLGKGIWQGGLNLTDVAPPVAPIPEAFVLTGTIKQEFTAQNGDVFFGHSAFVAAPELELENIVGSILFMEGGTGQFADAYGAFVYVNQRGENTTRVVGEVCGVKRADHKKRKHRRRPW